MRAWRRVLAFAIVLGVAAAACGGGGGGRVSIPPAPPAWKPLGPRSFLFPDQTTVGAGRVNAVVMDPRNHAVVFIGTDGARPTGPAGNPLGDTAVGLPDTGGAGVWKTTNWGSESPTWTALTDDQPSPSVGVNGLAMAPGDPDVLYAAADGPQGAILKSSDGGNTWTAQAQSIFGGVKFGGIAVSPVDPDTAYAGVFRGDSNGPGGVYKTTDGGTNWSLITGFMGDASHVIIDPSAPDILYAGFVDPSYPSSQGIWKSTDAGATARRPEQRAAANDRGQSPGSCHGLRYRTRSRQYA